MPSHAPNLGQFLLLCVAALFFSGAFVAEIARRRRRSNALRLAVKSCTYWGLCCGFASLVWHAGLQANHWPLEDNFETLAFLGLLLAGFILYIQRVRPMPALDLFLLPVVVLMLAGALLFGSTKPDVYRADSFWSWSHRLSSYGGAVAFAVAGAGGCLYLIASAHLRNKPAHPAPEMGSLERIERFTHSAIVLGFALLTIGMITGLIKVLHDGPRTQLGPHWMTSPKVLLAFSVWIVYALALHTPISPGLRGRKSAMLSIVGFVLMLGTLVAVQFVPSAK
jgi:ABC-type transport system involved in cytochrome c biogenesis permease subunit